MNSPVYVRPHGQLARLFLWALPVDVVIVLLACWGLGGCEKTTIVDQCMRRQYFERCLQVAPAGPQSTKYNDWAEVVEECENTAYYHALRARALVAAECRSGM